MTNWRETQSSTQAFDKLYHHLIGSLLEFQLVPPQFLVRLEKIIMILYPDIVRKIAEHEGATVFVCVCVCACVCVCVLAKAVSTCHCDCHCDCRRVC